MLYREALKTGCYDLQKARDTYRSFVQEEGIHRDLFLRYAEVSSAHTFQSVTWEGIWGVFTVTQRVLHERGSTVSGASMG